MLFAQFLLVLPLPALCQTATDSQTLRALLTEVRQLRQELRTTNIASQRAQILIYRMQAQQTVEEEDAQPRRIELEEELRLEQTKLAQLHDELDRIDKALEQASHALQ